MKSINSLFKWILFVPVCIMSVALVFFNGLNPGSVSDFFVTNDNGVARIVAFSILGLFVFGFIISLFDRKTSPVHLIRKNIFCGVTAVAAALCMAANAAYEVTSIVNSDESLKFITVITVLLTASSGIAMLYFGLNHFNGSNSKGKISILYLSLPLWCGAHLIDRFLNNTATPVAATETMDLIMFVALAMFFINAAMVHSMIAVKNAVKATINFGLPTVVIALVFSVIEAFNVVNADEFIFMNIIPSIAYSFVALYTMGFVAELSFRSKTVDEQIILEENEEENTGYSDEYYADEEDADDIADTQFEDVPSDFEYDEDEQGTDDFTESDLTSVDVDSVQDVSQSSDDVHMPEMFAIRSVDDDTDEEEEIVYSENVDFDDDSSEEIQVADELFKAAQQSDLKSSEKKATNNPGSENDMILAGESEKVQPVRTPAEKHHGKPKGPTTREAIMYEDDEFILSVNNTNIQAEKSEEDDEISAYIFDDHTEQDSKKKSYAERLDEIDQLIISIQGGDSPEDK